MFELLHNAYYVYFLFLINMLQNPNIKQDQVICVPQNHQAYNVVYDQI